MSVDRLDRLLLFELDQNARQPVSRIAKRLRISKQVAGYRLKRLETEGLIKKYFTVPDISRLGYTNFKVLVRLQNASESQERAFISFLVNHPAIMWVARCDGRFDLMFNIMAKNVGELNIHLEGISERYGRLIGERQTSPMLLARFYERAYLRGETHRTQKPGVYGGSPPAYELDEVEAGILSELCWNGRALIPEMARRLRISPDTVRLRIRKLEKEGIIQRYLIVPNNPKLGQLHYKLLVGLNVLGKEKRQALEAFFQQEPRIFFTNQTFGNWEMEIDVEMESQEQFRAFLAAFRNRFSKEIRDYTALNVYEVHKFDFYPMRKRPIPPAKANQA